MKQKIEWYREVLELEPGSRVFFSLAKLLAADGQISEAVTTLQQGLRRHPDHVEARLLLIELLHLQNAETELTGEIDGLGALLASYPGFWKAWSERLSANPSMLDASLAMSFFAAALQGKSVSWATVINQGIQALLHPREEQGAVAQDFAVLGRREEPPVAHTAARAEGPEPPLPFAESSPPVSETLSSLESFEKTAYMQTADTGGTISQQKHQEVDAEPEAGKTVVPTAEEEESEEAFSLRTRSMAEVLAEQGDIAGALDIYTELIQSASPGEKSSLEARAEELFSRMHSSSSGESKTTEEKNLISGGESNRLVTLLESLAQRLEARAR